MFLYVTNQVVDNQLHQLHETIISFYVNDERIKILNNFNKKTFFFWLLSAFLQNFSLCQDHVTVMCLHTWDSPLISRHQLRALLVGFLFPVESCSGVRCRGIRFVVDMNLVKYWTTLRASSTCFKQENKIRGGMFVYKYWGLVIEQLWSLLNL